MLTSLHVFNRHALFLVPVLGFVFAAIAGWVGNSYGVPNLFRDHPGEFCVATATSATCPQFWQQWSDLSFGDFVRHLLGRAMFTSINFQNGGFGAALISLIWTVCVLCYAREEDQGNQPIESPITILWPGAILLIALFIVAPTQLSISNALYDTPYADEARAFHLWGLLQTLLGAAIALGVVYVALWFAIYWSRWYDIPQLFTTMATGSLIVALFWFALPLMPGFAVFLTLASLALLYALLLIIPRGWQFAFFLALAAVVARGQSVPFKHRFDALASYYGPIEAAPRLSLTSQSEPPDTTASLQPPVEALDAWKTNYQAHHGSEKPVLALVTAAGGGYRAAYWTALVLDTLKSREANAGETGSIQDSLFLFSGASGGMVAASYYVATRTDTQNTGNDLVAILDRDIALSVDKPETFTETFRNTRRDSLTPVVKKWLRHDFPGFIWQTPFRQDRGTQLEALWQALTTANFADLLEGQRQGWRPSIIYAPMLIDSGRPLLISNLDLSEFSRSDSRALELFRSFPAAQKKITLAAAARMSASFPFVAPASEIPFVEAGGDLSPLKGDRVVDAGYYDNDGISIATTFLRQPKVLDWIRENTSGVVLLRVNAFSPQTARAADQPPCSQRANETTEERVAKMAPKSVSVLETVFPNWRRSLRWITSPFEGAYVARGTAGRIANEQHVRGLASLFGSDPQNGPFFLSVEIAADDRGSISWLLPQSELNQMKDDLKNICNIEAFDRLEGFWRQRAQ